MSSDHDYWRGHIKGHTTERTAIAANTSRTMLSATPWSRSAQKPRRHILIRIWSAIPWHR